MGPPDSAGLKEVAALCPKAHMQIRAVRILEVSLMIFLRPESQVLEGSVNTGGRLDRLRQLTHEQRANRIAYLKDQINISHNQRKVVGCWSFSPTHSRRSYTRNSRPPNSVSDLLRHTSGLNSQPCIGTTYHAFPHCMSL
jgi:hypothetical protein